MGTRHNIFLSYYHEQDQNYKDRFVRMMGDNIVDKSVDLGDIIDNNLPTEAVLQRIREDYIAQVSVTVVLIGECTWQRKYVDWEIGISLRETPTNLRCGLLGILLPEHRDFQQREYEPQANTTEIGGQPRWGEPLRLYPRLDAQCRRNPWLDSPSLLEKERATRSR